MDITYDLSHLLGYLSIFATILFGIWGIYVTIKNRFFARITFVLKKSIALFDTIVKNIPELSILYEGAPISQNLMLIEGALVNTGTKDILPTKIEKPISLNLPEDYKWVAAKIISTSNNVEADITLNDLNLTINSGLIKINEYIVIQALLQAPHDDNMGKIENKMQKIIKCCHRIADMPNIKNLRLLNIETKHLIWGIALILFAIIFSAYAGYNVATTTPIMEDIYIFKKSNNETIKVMVNKIENHKFTLEGIDIPFNQTLTSEEFFKKCKKIGEMPTGLLFLKIMSMLFAIMSIGCLILLFGFLREYRMNKKLVQIFALKQ